MKKFGGNLGFRLEGLVFINNVNAIELILPKSKPINSELDKPTDNIVPLKKPSLKVEIKPESKKNDLTQKTELKEIFQMI